MLRALLPGRPTLDCLFSNVLLDNATLLKVLPDGCVPCTQVLQAWGRVRAICHTLCHQEHALAVSSFKWPERQHEKEPKSSSSHCQALTAVGPGMQPQGRPLIRHHAAGVEQEHALRDCGRLQRPGLILGPAETAVPHAQPHAAHPQHADHPCRRARLGAPGTHLPHAGAANQRIPWIALRLWPAPRSVVVSDCQAGKHRSPE